MSVFLPFVIIPPALRDCSVHGCFLLGRPLHVRVKTRHVHAERHLAKAGVASVKGRSISHPWNGAIAGVERAQRRSAQRSAEDWGDPLTRAGGRACERT
jgi:hypothetical protein